MLPCITPSEKNTQPSNTGKEEGNQLNFSVTKEKEALGKAKSPWCAKAPGRGH